MSSLQGSFGTKFSSDVIALRVLGDSVHTSSDSHPKGLWYEGLAFWEGFYESY